MGGGGAGEVAKRKKNKKQPWSQALISSTNWPNFGPQRKCCLDGRSELQKPFNEKNY
jgi:hypothetical protein